MTDHLTKAKAALEHASDLDVDLAEDTLPTPYLRLLDLASIQASLATAEATERIADALEALNERNAMHPIPTCNDRTATRGVNAVHEVRPESEGSDDR